MKNADCTTCDWQEPELLEPNYDAFDLFQEIQTQWRFDPAGNRCGLDYNVLYLEAARLKIELTTITINQIKALEKHIMGKMADVKNSNHGVKKVQQGIKSRP